MAASHSTISITYDAQQDRLKLLVISKQQQQVEAAMTRRLFKTLLAQLPEWLATKNVTSLKQSDRVKSVKQQQAESQSEHEAAQQQRGQNAKCEVTGEINHFVIHSVNISITTQSQAKQIIEMNFASKDENENILLSLSSTQFHQVIANMLEKAGSWDLVSPWKKDKAGIADLPPRNVIVH